MPAKSADHFHVVVETESGHAETMAHSHRVNGGPHSHTDSASLSVSSESLATRKDARAVLATFKRLHAAKGKRE